VDETGAALQALAAGGRRGGAVSASAVSYLRRAQNPDGGFGQTRGYRSNSQSTAWAVQGLVAARRDPRKTKRGRRSALAYLASLQQPDGSYRYSRTSEQTPVWVTAQVVAALRRRALPLRPPPRRATAAGDRVGARSTGAGPQSPAGLAGRGSRGSDPQRDSAGAPRPSLRRAAASARAARGSAAAARLLETRSAARAVPERAEGGDRRHGFPAAAAAAATALAAGAALWLARRRSVRSRPP
jgi:hypothetical protein